MFNSNKTRIETVDFILSILKKGEKFVTASGEFNIYHENGRLIYPTEEELKKLKKKEEI